MKFTTGTLEGLSLLVDIKNIPSGQKWILTKHGPQYTSFLMQVQVSIQVDMVYSAKNPQF